MPVLLLLLGQSPFDPTSGAAQSTRLIAELAARSGFTVKALATTACEGECDTEALHREVSAKGELLAPPGRWWHFRKFGIEYRLLKVADAWKHSWEHHVGTNYESALEQMMSVGEGPDLVLTYGDDPTDRARRARLQAAGALVVFAVHNHIYRKQQPVAVDQFLFPTHYLANAYGPKYSNSSVVLPVPLQARTSARVDSPSSLLTFVNPEPAKGAILVAQLIDRLRRTHPEQPILVVGGRVPAEGILQVGRDLKLDLNQHPQLFLLPPTPNVDAIWAETGLLLMPSVVPEAAGRCALESMLFGAVPCVSDRAGLRELVGDAGLRLPCPPPLTGKARPVPNSIVNAWHSEISRLLDDRVALNERGVRCRQWAEQHTMDELMPQYASWLGQICC
jgi:hypothetical protein